MTQQSTLAADRLWDVVAAQRRSLADLLDGLTDEQLRRASVPPSPLTLLGLVQHLAEVERNWFRRVLLGEQVAPIHDPDADAGGHDGGFDVAADSTFDCGAFTTITPRFVADATSTLSRPMPARPTTTRSVPASSTSAVTCVALRITSAAAPLRRGAIVAAGISLAGSAAVMVGRHLSVEEMDSP